MPQVLPRRRFFIGSSTEAIEVARTLEELLARDAQVELWPHAFALGDMPLDALLRELDKCHYAALVITSDDVTMSRNTEQPSPRDNVIFEAGLFMGRFGPKRSFLVYDQNARPKLPSDLAGLTYAAYDGAAFAANPLSCLGPAANKIRRAMRQPAIRDERQFIASFLAFVPDDTSLADTYLDLITRRLPDSQGNNQQSSSPPEAQPPVPQARLHTYTIHSLPDRLTSENL